MTAVASPVANAWELALNAARVFAVDPHGLGGVAIKSPSGVVRDRWLAYFSLLRPVGAPLRKVPLHVTDERLLGGLDLAATLKAGKPIAERGLLAEANGGVLLLQRAERVSSATAARIASAMDQGEVRSQRDGFDTTAPSAFGVIALDEGVADDERAPPALLERMAFLIDLDAISHRGALPPTTELEDIEVARQLARRVAISDELIAALCGAAIAMGIESVRAAILAVRVARIVAALDGRESVSQEDAALSAQLVFAPRATQLPNQQTDDQTPQAPEPPPQTDQETSSDDDQRLDAEQLADMILEAAKAVIPAGLLAALKVEHARRARGKSSGRAGAKQASLRHGRPAGVRRGEPKSGARLNLVETLRAAAAWQPLRRREAAIKGARSANPRRIEVRKDDFRITRLKNPAETTTIFVVDASGSLALNRLAEAKGAVELLLADCYVRRDRVALIAFRGKTAELLLPPTRSLARAKRGLAGLPGGGGTPLALGLDAAFNLADTVRRKGQTPNVIVLTDGRANIARDGSPGRPKAEADGLAAALGFALAGIACLVIDTSPNPAEQSERLSRAMSAIYLPLPRADAAALSKAVRATTTDAGLHRASGA